ncbi:hypothetical protein P7K49_028896 [Saguinus oedipus]|uniref:Uncharacterized protein n=1 Tax=Saguinus oedipus TaxID=9490 RepID=A0ABQ9U5M8_SAGOE|nr:hypothetical protein P7K49_028896 [Saguinus oedipus]
METYPSARNRRVSLFSSFRVASRLFPPSSFVPREQRDDACAKPSRRIYKCEPGLFLVVPSGPLPSEGLCLLLRRSSSGRCELEPSTRVGHHVALRTVRRSEHCEAVGLARRLGDGYSACVMAASAHAIRSQRQRGRGGEGRRDAGSPAGPLPPPSAAAAILRTLTTVVAHFLSAFPPLRRTDRAAAVTNIVIVFETERNWQL